MRRINPELPVQVPASVGPEATAHLAETVPRLAQQ